MSVRMLIMGNVMQSEHTYAGHGRRILLKIVETRDAPLSQLKKAYLQKLVGNDTSQFAFE
jgi:hypothetical protein